MSSSKILRLADLFCGAGGTSTGAVEAAEQLGYRTELTAINHWPVAIATHTVNHPAARHLCTSIDDVNPRALYGESELDLLWASPECTHHSVARGGRPINDQSRATAWCVVRWAEALRPGVILIENVPEFLTWGGIGTDGRPLKRKKGETFRAWRAALESLGYRVDHRILCAADYGDPTTRKRLFVQAVRGKRRIVWPDPTHAAVSEVDLFGGTRKAWVPAREIIDWSLPAQSIYERKKPLSQNTMNRIREGLKKFGIKPSVVRYQGNHAARDESARCAQSVEEPLSTVTVENRFGVSQPFLVPQHSSNGPRSVDEPAPTVTTTSRGVGLAEPFLVQVAHGNDDATSDRRRSRDLNAPLDTLPCTNTFGLAQPFVIGAGGPEYASKAKSVEEPLTTVTTENHRALVQPFILPNEGVHGGNAPRSVDDPLNTVTASRGAGALVQPFIMSAGGPECAARSTEEPVGTVLTRDHRALVQPFIVPNFGEREGQAPRTHSVQEPLPAGTSHGAGALVDPFLVKLRGTNDAASLDAPSPTVTATGTHLGLAEPYLVTVANGGEDKYRARSVDEPIPTVTAGGARVGLAEPFLVQVNHAGDDASRTRSTGQPLPTVCGNRGEWAVCDAQALLPQQSGGALRSVDEPAPTIATDGAVGLVEPYLVEFYGTGGAESLAEPLNTVTAKERHALVRPEVIIDGHRYLLDIRFRMLQPHELAAAQGFRRDYQFTGTKSDQVKQIGNAVPRRLVRAIVTAVLTQNPDVRWLTDEEQKGAA